MRLIDADALIERNKALVDCEFIHAKYQATLREVVDDEPTVDAVKVVHGHWEVAIGYDPKKSFQCSECRLMAYEPTKYCPHCGAKMEKVTE